jgi:outer membrane protein assembly factor BamB
LAVFDTKDQAFAPTSIGLPDCAASQLLSLPAGDLAILCGKSANDLRLVAGSGKGSAANVERVVLPRQSDDRRDLNGNRRELGQLSGAAVSSGTGSLFSVTQNGKVLVVDRSSGTVLRTVDLGLSSDQWLPPKVPAVSPDGATLFLSVGTLKDQSEQRATGILAIDTTTWKSRTFSTSRPFWSLTLSSDGSQLYALDPDAHALVVLDPRTGREIRTIDGLGSSPVMAVVAP